MGEPIDVSPDLHSASKKQTKYDMQQKKELEKGTSIKNKALEK